MEEFPVLIPSLQIGFYQRLQEVRKNFLLPALLDQVGKLDIGHWTVINVRGIDKARWRQESPTTTELFYLSHLADPQSVAYQKFKEYLIAELGI